jgi:hypothetical protein
LRRVLQLAVAVAVAVPSLVCAQQQQPAPPAAVAGSGDVAARVGERVITVADVDRAWRDADAGAQAQAAQALYDGRRQTLDRLVADILIEQAAKAKGVPAAQFANEEIARRTKPVADADVDAFYQQNAARLQGKRLDEVSGAIRTFLQEQQATAARAAFVEELRKAGPPVRVALDPPRQRIEVAATDPSRGGANAAVVLVEYSDYQ